MKDINDDHQPRQEKVKKGKKEIIMESDCSKAHINGVLKSKVSNTTSLLRNVEFKDANLQIRLEYVQNRMDK